MSGYEHDYDPQYWTPLTNLTNLANCYAYALNTYDGPGYRPVPGTARGHYYSLSYIRAHTPEILAEDAPFYSGKVIQYTTQYTTQNATPGTRQYKIAYVFANDRYGNPDAGDFHFYRQDSNDYWSHKCGLTAISQLDSTGYVISNPMTCGRNYGVDFNYSIWGGFYMVTY